MTVTCVTKLWQLSHIYHITVTVMTVMYDITPFFLLLSPKIKKEIIENKNILNEREMGKK